MLRNFNNSYLLVIISPKSVKHLNELDFIISAKGGGNVTASLTVRKLTRKAMNGF